MIRKTHFLVTCHLSHSDDLIQSGFLVIPKIVFADLWKPTLEIIVIPVSSDPLSLANVERNEKKMKNWISRDNSSELFPAVKTF